MTTKSLMNRRQFLGSTAAFAGLTVSACSRSGEQTVLLPSRPLSRNRALQYAAMPNEAYVIPAVDLKKVPSKYLRRQVTYITDEKPGTIIVDTKRFYLYHIEQDQKAMRYGVGLGRAGFEWSGRARVAWKRKWPKWTPPDEMIERQPELEKYSSRNGGMAPGLNNPLGSRALYIFQGKVDTLYRIHGSPEYWTIGKAVSSGCVRMINQDVVHLYERVKADSPIVVT